MAVLRKPRTFLMLALLTLIYIFNELGHFLLGVVTRSLAQSIEYGDRSCIPNQNISAAASLNQSIGKSCRDYDTNKSCNSAQLHTDSEIFSCEWNYNGGGYAYQMLAGPAYMACFTISGVLWGFTGVTANRVNLLCYATFGVGTALTATAFATQYWHLVVCRMILATCTAACTPLSAGLLGDAFPVNKCAIVMGIFNCGIFVGFGTSFALGAYTPETSLITETWRTSYLATGIPPLILSLVLMLTTSEVSKRTTMEFNATATKDENVNKNENWKHLIAELLKVFGRSEILILMFAASIRHSAGYAWGYNSVLFFQTYHPQVDFGWRLTSVTITGGIIGCVVGGIICDLVAKRYGTFMRTLYLSVCMLVAAPFAAAVLSLDPPFSFVALFTTFIASETWFGAFYAVLLEIAPANQMTTVVAVTVLIINNIGGNLPVFVQFLSKLTDYRTALLIQYPGALLLSSLLFLACWTKMRKRVTPTKFHQNDQTSAENVF